VLSYTSHARTKMTERGVREEEVVETVRAGALLRVRGNRIGRRRVFAVGYQWEGRDYLHKEVAVIYTEEGEQQVIVTVLARYGRWEEAL